MSPDLEATGIEGLEEDVPESLVTRLEEAQRRYQDIAVAASDGDPLAAAEARALEIQIDGLLAEAKRESIARQMRERQALTEREKELREQRERDREHYAVVLAKRDEAFALTRSRLAVFLGSARALFELEDETQDAAGRAGERFISTRHDLSNCVAVAGREIGLEDPPIGYVLAGERKRLVERFPDLLAVETPQPPSVPADSGPPGVEDLPSPVPALDRRSICDTNSGPNRIRPRGRSQLSRRRG